MAWSCGLRVNASRSISSASGNSRLISKCAGAGGSALLVFGLGLTSEVAFGTLHGIVPVMVFSMSAVRNIKPVLIRTGRALGLSTWSMMRTILLPAAFPEIFTGLRIGFSVTLLGTVMSEMFGSKRGLGFLLMNALGVNDVQLIMSLALMLVTFAAIANTALMAIERRIYRLKRAANE